MNVASLGQSEPTAAGSAARRDPARELNDRFLKLLVAQMKNQDPLNPLDNAQVTSQMAQINTVTGINGLNDTVQRLLEQFGTLESLQAAQLTGRSVLVSGRELTIGADRPEALAGVELAAPADRVTVEIRDAAGQVLRTLELGRAASGVQRFAWDGPTDAGVAVAPGQYSFNVKAVAGGAEVGATPLALRVVEAVTRESGQTRLVLAGGQRVATHEVRQIL